MNNDIKQRTKIPWKIFSEEDQEQIYKYYSKYVKSGGNELYRYSKVQNTILDFYFMQDVDMDNFEDFLENEIKDRSPLPTYQTKNK